MKSGNNIYIIQPFTEGVEKFAPDFKFMERYSWKSEFGGGPPAIVLVTALKDSRGRRRSLKGKKFLLIYVGACENSLMEKYKLGFRKPLKDLVL